MGAGFLVAGLVGLLPFGFDGEVPLPGFVDVFGVVVVVVGVVRPGVEVVVGVVVVEPLLCDGQDSLTF